jgi:hypothetical protein
MFCRWNVRYSEKRGDCVGKTKRGKGTKLRQQADGAGTPLGIHVEKANPSEVKLLEQTLDAIKLKREKANVVVHTSLSD